MTDAIAEIGILQDFSRALRIRIAEVTDPLGSEVAIWRWVRDPKNESDVREIAARFLLTSMRQQKRAVTRKEEERVRLEAYSAELNAHYSTPEGIAELAEWERKGKAERAAKAKAARVRNAQLLKQIKATRPEVRAGDVSPAQFDAVELGFPIGDLLFGEARHERKQAYSRIDHQWENEHGFKIRRRALIEALNREDDNEYGFFRKVAVAIEDWKTALKAEWTAELLMQTFRVDGVTVSWGEATVEQHRRRAEALRSHAMGTLETASLHLAAIDDLDNSGAANLYQIASIAA